ncbi:uncharacterized protein LOC107611407 [Arachis ipaensis]|uniref:uncharacterized protein LOC107611407 n=1 Tax=Arachis ipaensis TaxID=130454 RepID=UPI0007AF5B9A|nr:uncharacterized protein LOC107611407 [Arachis ipaensis]XP_025670487.1 uncharacterized protein LOC112770330 [Arachis hypogaea]
MVSLCRQNGNVIHIYFEHGPSVPEFIDYMELSDDDGCVGGEGSFSGDSWKSDELRTPPNSNDKVDPVVNPIFNDVAKFGQRKTRVQLSRTNITRSLGDARKIVRGDKASLYAKFSDYTEELLRSNPGSTVKLGVNAQPKGDPIFQNFYVCLHGCKQGFVHGCRPSIGLDAAFLKTFYGGWLMCVVEQDANNYIYPIAWAIVPVENTTTWKWFLELLHENIGSYQEHNWDYLDLMNGLIPHLWHNFQKRWKDKHMKSLLWACVRAQTVPEFNKSMQTLKTINVKAWEYLDKIPRQS